MGARRKGEGGEVLVADDPVHGFQAALVQVLAGRLEGLDLFEGELVGDRLVPVGAVDAVEGEAQLLALRAPVRAWRERTPPHQPPPEKRAPELPKPPRRTISRATTRSWRAVRGRESDS
ncbi:hypothetical protein D3C81_1439980 [compost metagenome]